MIHVQLTLDRANMICSGLADVCNIGICLGTQPCRVIVQAVETPLSSPTLNTIECDQVLTLARKLDVVPHEPKDQLGNFIGTFIATPNPNLDSIWAYGEPAEMLCGVKEPMFFTKPIPSTETISEEALSNAARAILPYVVPSGQEIVITVGEFTFNHLGGFLGKTFDLPLTDDMAYLIFANDNLSDYRKVTFIHGKLSKSFEFEADNEIRIDKNNKGEIQFSRSNFRGFDIMTSHFRFNLRKRVY